MRYFQSEVKRSRQQQMNSIQQHVKPLLIFQENGLDIKWNMAAILTGSLLAEHYTKSRENALNWNPITRIIIIALQHWSVS